MKIAQFLKRVGEYEAEFEQLNFDDEKKLAKLSRSIVDDTKVVATAISKNEKHLQRIRDAREKQDQRNTDLRAEEKIVAARWEENKLFDDERRLHQIQFQLRTLEREKKDYALTRDSLRQWLLDLDRAKAMLEMMQSSLQRNMDRLGVDMDEEKHTRTGILGVTAICDDKVGRTNNVQCPVGCKWYMSIGGRFHRRTPKVCSKCSSKLKFSRGRGQFVAYTGSWPGWDAVDAHVINRDRAKHLRHTLSRYGDDFSYNEALSTVIRDFKSSVPPFGKKVEFKVWGLSAISAALSSLQNAHGMPRTEAKEFLNEVMDIALDEVCQ
jgi:hypothetical protein